VTVVGTLAGWSQEWASYRNQNPAAADSIWTWALVNPRGLGFAIAIAAASLAAWIVSRVESTDGDRLDTPPKGLGTAQQLGVFAHLTGLRW